jgi:hypothetical protein
MAFSEKMVYEENDSRARDLIAKYNITKLPALFLLAEDAAAYPIYDSLKTVGDVADEWWILRTVVPPYVDLAANHTEVGIVRAVFLVNSSCSDCFDVKGLSDYIAGQSGIFIANTSVYEINSTEGKAMAAEYNITAIPALLYSPDAKYYPMFDENWKNLNNTIESDGWYVFRAHEALQSTYQKIG